MLNNEINPVVGEGVSMRGYSDVNPGTIIKVSPNGKRVWVQADSATLLNGANSGQPDALKVTPGGFACHTEGVQRWNIQRDTNGAVISFSLRKNGKWIASGGNPNTGMRLTAGRRKFYDFNF